MSLPISRRLPVLPVFLLLLTAAALVRPATAQDCTVSFFLGEVQVRRAGTSDWKEADFGMALKAGDVIRTMVESRAELKLADGSIVNVNEKSIFEVKKVSGAAQQNSFKLLTGKISANVKKLTKSRAEFKVESPVAIAAIRGTKFSMHVMEGKANIAVTEGKVEVKLVKSKQTVTVGANQEIDVTDEQFQLKVIEETKGKDETPPKLNLETPKGGAVLTATEVEVKGETEAKAAVTLNGKAVTVDAKGRFAEKITLTTEGTQSITLTASDSAGNVLELIVDVMINTSSPEIKLASSAGDSTTEEVCNITGSVTDKTPEDELTATLNKDELSLSEGNFTKTVRLVEGENTFAVEATDLAGHTAKAEITVKRVKGQVTKDTQAPAVTFTDPAAGATVYEPTVAIQGNITDNYPLEELKATIKTDGGTENLNLSSGVFSYNAALVEGENTFTVIAVDKAGNQGTADLTLIKKVKDTNPPVLTILTDLENEFTNLSPQRITINVQDAEGTDGLKVKVDGELIELSGGTYNHMAYLEAGLNKVSIVAEDASGNQTAEDVEIFYDNIVPSIIVTRPSAGVNEFNFPGPGTNYAVEKTYTVTGFIQDPEPSSGIESVIINGQEVKVADDGTFEFVIETHKGQRIVGGKNYEIQLEIQTRDRAGNLTIDNSRSINLNWQ